MKYLILLLLTAILYAETVTVIAIERMHWSVICHNNIDFFSIVQTANGKVYLGKCTHLGKVGETVNVNLDYYQGQ